MTRSETWLNGGWPGREEHGEAHGLAQALAIRRRGIHSGEDALDHAGGHLHGAEGKVRVARMRAPGNASSKSRAA